MNIVKEATSRFLVMMAMGIGDAVAVGLSAIDQIVKNEPEADGKIDVVCNDLQSDIFRYDPRINTIIRCYEIGAMRGFFLAKQHLTFTLDCMRQLCREVYPDWSVII